MPAGRSCLVTFIELIDIARLRLTLPVGWLVSIDFCLSIIFMLL